MKRPSGPSNLLGVLNDSSGSRLGTEGWTTFGGLAVSEGDTGAYNNHGGNSWNNTAFNWELTFGSAAAVPGAGVAGLSLVGLAGLRRRRR